MLVVLSGGGTAGHINPALAVAEELQRRGCEVRYAGTPAGVESRLAAQAGLPFQGFDAAGFDRSRPWMLPSSLIRLFQSSRKAQAWFSQVKPNAAVCFGGYVCVPVGRAALKCGVPLVVHEQNSVMGMANEYLAKSAAAVCLTYAHAAEGVGALKDSDKVRLTGNPVRSSVFDAQRDESRAALGIPANARLLLVTGGSLGARHLNQALVAMKDALLARPDLHIIHVSGPKEFESVAQALALTPNQEKRWHLVGYTDQMGRCMAAADAIVSRAGASSLAEISARALPALLVPFPYATADHQTMNARSCVESGAAFMVPDDQVDGPEFREKLLMLVDDASVRARMAKAASSQGARDAARLVADAVMEAARTSAVGSAG